MSLDLPDVRPHVITPEFASQLGEFLRFRHVFRNVYGFALEADRMQPLEEQLASARDRLTAEIGAFCAWMLGPDPG